MITPGPNRSVEASSSSCPFLPASGPRPAKSFSGLAAMSQRAGSSDSWRTSQGIGSEFSRQRAAGQAAPTGTRSRRRVYAYKWRIAFISLSTVSHPPSQARSAALWLWRLGGFDDADGDPQSPLCHSFLLFTTLTKPLRGDSIASSCRMLTCAEPSHSLTAKPPSTSSNTS